MTTKQCIKNKYEKGLFWWKKFYDGKKCNIVAMKINTNHNTIFSSLSLLKWYAFNP